MKEGLPNRRVEKILGMFGRGSSGSKRHHILPWTLSRSESKRKSSTKVVAGSGIRTGPLSFQAATKQTTFRLVSNESINT